MEKKEGRTFDDSDDEEFELERNNLKILLEKFENLDYVLENAALTAVLLHYVFNKSMEYFSLLYYYIIRKYIRLNETKNSMRNYNHINMEIYTAFIHPNSILQISFPNEDLLTKIEQNIDSEDCIIYFNKISEFITREVLTKYLEQLRESIRLGLDSYSYTNCVHEDMSRTKELKMLEALHVSLQESLIRNQKCRCLPLQKPEIKNLRLLHDFQIRAIKLAMDTQYEYFILSKKYSYIIKNPESIIPPKTFLSCPLVKLVNKQRVKGHSFDELSLSRVFPCAVCDLILWGSFPCCLFCRNCKKAIHRECKDSIKYCQIDQKIARKCEHIQTETDKEKLKTEQVAIDLAQIIDDTKVSSDFNASQQNSNRKTVPEDFLEKGAIQNIKVADGSKLVSKLSIVRSPDSKLQIRRENIRKANSVKSTKSMNAKNDIKQIYCNPVFRSGSSRSDSTEIHLNNYRLQRRSTSEDSRLAETVEPLVISRMDLDDEMRVLETFEPEIELKLFSQCSNKLNLKDKGGYQRLLVLMEFHHKTKFIRMTLKRFKYLLVDPWIKMDEYLDLFESLGLSCVDKLYQLIGSLVAIIDLCKGDDTYEAATAQRVLNWLSENEDKNMKRWLQLSTDLCCTNILHSVKAMWIEYKQVSTKLSDLFAIEINRLLIIEQLSNMRSLLFNLPMIVTKIVKDLKRWSQFKDEAKVWEKVCHKLSYMPQLIDERCMPVVHLINNGIIMSSSLKYKRYKNDKEYSRGMELYINNFPKTVFKNDFIDFQFVKISNLRESRHVEPKSMQSSVYVREEVDAAVICYDKEIILLQKENDKYLLKQFKSPGANKLFPMISLDQVHVTKQTVKENKQYPHELTVLLLNQAILAQILFREEKSRDMWFDHITKKSIRFHKEISVRGTTPSTLNSTNNVSNFNFDERLNDLEETNAVSKCARMSILRANFNETVSQFLSTFDLILKELSTDEDQEHALKRIHEIGPSSPNEFMFGYMEALKQYAILGSQMMEQSQTIDPSLLLQRDIISMNKSKLTDITEQMSAVIQSIDQRAVESESSDDLTLDVKNGDSLVYFNPMSDD